ncbi:unnamed protein product [Rangifer tarandus platyrhynchus]|uniref:Uncharacterized protein n=2 Tax=Rangifer tarandus platyrhynchus TaxID=3082113 RepID=A0ABN8ZM89_RANTA|nr:unnamed protein product [Rangifer tarandus platyrhynchus]CAI9707037.1 unnamed protein product [Rangifer tarandus platyrhynchus]
MVNRSISPFQTALHTPLPRGGASGQAGPGPSVDVLWTRALALLRPGARPVLRFSGAAHGAGADGHGPAQHDHGAQFCSLSLSRDGPQAQAGTHRRDSHSQTP